MTISADYAPNIDLGNGVTTAFAVNFPFGAKADLKITLNTIATGIDITPAPVLNGAGTYDYSVAGTPDADTGIYPNGTVTFITAPPSTLKVVRERITPQRQNTSLTNNGPFPAKTVEGTFDREEMQLQEAGSLLTRALHAPAAVQPNSMELPGDWFAGNIMFAYDAVLKKPTTAAGLAYLVSVIPGLTLSVITAAATALFPTTATLLSAFSAPTVLPNGMTTVTAGRTSASDGGGGTFRYDSADTTTADNGATIRVDAAGRRWKAVLPGFILDKMAGVVGDASTDDTTAVQRLFTAGETHRMPVVFTTAECKLTGGISFDIYKTHPIGNGVKLNWQTVVSSVAVPYCVTITTTHNDPNTMAQIHKARPVDGVTFVFPDFSTGVKGIKLTPTVISTVSWINGLVFQNGGYVGGLNQIEFGAGAFDITHSNWGFSSTSGITGSHGIVTTDNGSSNSGEANKLINCFSANLAFPLYDAGGNVNADFFLYGCSLDNCSTAIYSAGARFRCYGCHIERWDTYIANVDNVAGGIFIYGGEIINTTMNTLVTAPFRSTSAIGGVEVHGVHFGLAGAYSLDTICEGSGRFVIRESSLGFNVGLVPFGIASNQIPNGAFAASIPAGWTLTAGVTWDGTTGKAANGSMKLDCAATAAPEASITVPCRPGDVVAAQAWMKSAGVAGTGHTRSMTIRYCDAGGNTISNAATDAAGTDLAAFTKVFIASSNTPAPPGTVFAKLVFSLVNGVAATQLWVDDVYLQVF